jgi:Predicted transcriptional regulator
MASNATPLHLSGHMTPAELKAARHALGLSAEGFARWVNVQSGRTVRRWEAGDRDIPGPVAVLVRAAMASRAVRAHFGLSLPDDTPGV